MAQLVERAADNREILGSIPSGPIPPGSSRKLWNDGGSSPGD